MSARDNRENAAFETKSREAWVIVTGKNKRTRQRHMYEDTIRSTRSEAWKQFSRGLTPREVRSYKRRGHMAIRVFLSTEMANP